MYKFIGLCIFLICAVVHSADTEEQFEMDTVKTSAGDLMITFIGHSTLIFTYGKKVVHVDPQSRMADYSTLTKADLVLITHEHGDHLDVKAVEQIRTDKTTVVYPKPCAEQLKGGTVMNNGDSKTFDGLKVEAVPAYNIIHMRSAGNPFHPKGVGNGYVITFGDTRVYIAGDTENIPEMKQLEGIDIAFLPMNLPYTMTPEMVADAAKIIKPKILYPYHFGDTDTSVIQNLLKNTKGIEVRIRKMQ